MEDDMRRHQIPAFGNWDFCDELPITQYFESARQAGLIRGHYVYEDVDLFKVPEPIKPANSKQAHSHPCHHKKARKGGQRKKQCAEPQKKPGRVSDVTAQTILKKPSAPKAVDEDLYRIPPELLYQKPKRKKPVRRFLLGCLGLNCSN